jgi:hypothetical protein
MISEGKPFGYLTREVGQIIMKVIEPVLERHQLSIAHYQVLNSIPFSEKTKIKEILRLFSDRGWIDPNNPYEEGTNRLKLTKVGLSDTKAIFNEINTRRKLLFKNITNEDFQITIQVMQQIIENEKSLCKEEIS